MLALLKTFSWQELLHHPWRNAAAVAAVMLGVALAFSVSLINASALSEFSQAVRSVNGQPDLELRAAQGGLDEALYARLATDPAMAHRLDLPRLRTLLDRWPAETPIEDAELAKGLHLALTRGITTARYIRYVEGRND